MKKLLCSAVFFLSAAQAQPQIIHNIPSLTDIKAFVMTNKKAAITAGVVIAIIAYLYSTRKVADVSYADQMEKKTPIVTALYPETPAPEAPSPTDEAMEQFRRTLAREEENRDFHDYIGQLRENLRTSGNILSPTPEERRKYYGEKNVKIAE